MFRSFRDRIAAGYKTFRFPGTGGGDAYGGSLLGMSSLGWMLPGSRYDWQRESGARHASRPFSA